MKVDVRLYRKTGYDLLNRPDSAATIDALCTEYYDLPDIYVVQNKGLSEIVVPLRYYTTTSIDYIRLTSKTPVNEDSFVQDDRMFFPDYEGVDTDHTFETVYYVVTGQPQMVNEKTARIPIQMDYITTFGISQRDFITGKINAAHVPVNDYKYTRIPETRFQPTGVLELDYYDVQESDLKVSDNTGNYNIINSTSDMISTAKSKVAIVKAGNGGWGDENERVAVALPEVKGNVMPTSIYLFKNMLFTDRLQAIWNLYTPPAYTSFLLHDVDATYTIDNKTYPIGLYERQTISELRALGLEDIILASYEVPKCYVNLDENNIAYDIYTKPTSTPSEIDLRTKLNARNELYKQIKEAAEAEHESEVNRLTSLLMALNVEIKELQAQVDAERQLRDVDLAQATIRLMQPVATRVNNALPTQFLFEYDQGGYTPRNKKVFTGENNRYVIVSKATGNEMSFNPEDLMRFNNNQSLDTKPSFVITADIRANGSPKCFAMYLHNQLNNNLLGINGLPWANSQITYVKDSGTELVNNQFRLESAERWANMERQGVNATFGMASQLAQLGAISRLGGDKSMDQIKAEKLIIPDGNGGWKWTPKGVASHFAGASLAVGAIAAVGSTFYNEYQIPQQAAFEQQQATIANYLATGNTIAPEIKFPRSEGDREIFGNLFTVYRYRYSRSMLQQMDAFYDLWGYMIGGIEISSETDDWLNNREYFNYISMTDVMLDREDLNVWEREGLATDLMNVRLWHNNVLPYNWRPSMYNNIRQVPTISEPEIPETQEV